MQSLPALNKTPCQVWSRLTYPLLYYSDFAADTLTLIFDPVTLTFYLERLQCVVCDVTNLCTKSERNKAIGDGVIAIKIFDLMTLNAV